MSTEKFELSGKVALVTGATSGIGKAVALALARKGMRLALVARRLDHLVSLKGEVEDLGQEAFPLAVDLREEAQILVAFDAVRRQWGGVDVLVNSAGLGRVAPLREGATEHFREMLEVNVLALAVATREAVMDMETRKTPGQIVHISSMSAYRVQGHLGMYAATKHAVRAMTEGLRQELRAAGSDIRVTSISPGDTDTEFMQRMLGSRKAARDARPPYEQLTPEDVADAVIHVLETPPRVEVHDILMRPVGQPD